MTRDPSVAAVAPLAAPVAAEVVLREQRLSVASVRHPTERVVLRRRVVSEVRQVGVTVQREELEMLRLPVDPDRSQDPSTRGEARAPLVIVLSDRSPLSGSRTGPTRRSP